MLCRELAFSWLLHFFHLSDPKGEIRYTLSHFSSALAAIKSGHSFILFSAWEPERLEKHVRRSNR